MSHRALLSHDISHSGAKQALHGANTQSVRELSKKLSTHYCFKEKSMARTTQTSGLRHDYSAHMNMANATTTYSKTNTLYLRGTLNAAATADPKGVTFQLSS